MLIVSVPFFGEWQRTHRSQNDQSNWFSKNEQYKQKKNQKKIPLLVAFLSYYLTYDTLSQNRKERERERKAETVGGGRRCSKNPLGLITLVHRQLSSALLLNVRGENVISLSLSVCVWERGRVLLWICSLTETTTKQEVDTVFDPV